MGNSFLGNKDNKFYYSSKSMVDDFGRVFYYNKRIFRKISNENFCLDLINTELFKRLEEEELIPRTFITNEFSDRMDSIVLEHERLLESLQHEWSYQMLKDAALLVLKINTICNEYGYELKDAHTLNILFKGCKPMYIDIGSISIKKNDDKWIAYEEFLNSLFLPLLYWSNNRQYFVRKLLESNFHRMFTIPSQTFLGAGLLSLISVENYLYKFSIKNRILLKTRNRIQFLDFVCRALNLIFRKVKIGQNPVKYAREEELCKIFPYESIQNTILNLKDPTSKSLWSGYHSDFYNDFKEIKVSERFRRLLEIIASYNDIKSVIDLAGNEGYFSYLISKNNNIDRVILVDYDENAINKAYLNFKQNNIVKITPLLLNFMFTPNMEGTAERLKSDLAIALAVTHHLLLTNGFSLSTIFERLTSYSNHYVMVEFMPLGLWSVEHKIEYSLPQWYNIDWFRKEFCLNFDLILEEKVEYNRVVFFGKIGKKGDGN